VGRMARGGSSPLRRMRIESPVRKRGFRRSRHDVPTVTHERRASHPTSVRLEPWAQGDLPLLRALLGDPAMTEHLGGPESEAKLAERQARYEHLADPGEGQMYKVLDAATGEPLGSVGYWERRWHADEVYETGWSVLPAAQGRGVAAAATAVVIALARSQERHRFLHAFPSVGNAPSNAICRRLGFKLVEEALELEYPPGQTMRCNDWRLDLFAR
jgi:RimJ/RimL family protein N-acetyltransferase